jgi:mannan endo-1,4-beta-mannosidase
MARFVFIILLAVFSFISCKRIPNEQHDCLPLSNLKSVLDNVSGKYILFGHQDAMAYGIGWNGVFAQSDVKRVTGSHPALFGWEIGNIGDETNLDKVPFDSIVSYIKYIHSIGGINTISWHARNPITDSDSWNLTSVDVPSLLPGGSNHALFTAKLDLVADFFLKLTDENGELIPFIFRPWHEMYGGWFWWGKTTCTDDDYVKLFRYSINYLREEKGIKNFLVAFSPDNNFDTKQQYLLRYPGDDMVDVLGIDEYGDFKNNRLDRIVIRLGIVSDLAKEKGKISAFTETGSDRLEIDNWYTSNLLQVLNASEKTRAISYVMVWRNHDLSHFYVPYPGHEQENDFVSFTNNKLIFLLDDLNSFNSKQ